MRERHRARHPRGAELVGLSSFWSLVIATIAVLILLNAVGHRVEAGQAG
ncbi:MAG TPA: hypothetical protein VF642_02010 [Propionibacteriaceae bacterium]